MSIPEHRLSTETVDAPLLDPDIRKRIGYISDWEQGPKGIGDTSEGSNYQAWEATYDGSDITLTPETEGSSTIILTGLANVEQLSFAFDQNAQPSVAWIINETCYFYWYDSQASEYVTQIIDDVVSVHLMLDDKRERQVDLSDIVLWITKRDISDPDIFMLYHLEQRERFTVEYLTKSDSPPYIAKGGMHSGLRVKLELSFTPP